MRRRFRMRSWILLIALVAIWAWVLMDREIGLWVLKGLAVVAATLLVMALAMGLGLLGFGIFGIGGRIVDWLRHASRWPDE